jgi:hypothetical protein
MDDAFCKEQTQRIRALAERADLLHQALPVGAGRLIRPKVAGPLKAAERPLPGSGRRGVTKSAIEVWCDTRGGGDPCPRGSPSRPQDLSGPLREGKGRMPAKSQ